jgi:molybdopterin-guanine dinucleotide biosynthesis protein A
MGKVVFELEAGILIGGQSKRFGQDKASLRFGKTTLLEHVYGILHKVIDKIWIIGHNQGSHDLPEDIFFEDIIPDAGPMGGLLTTLKKTDKPTLVVSCDTPFIESEHVEYLIKQYDSTKVATIARSCKGIEPLFGIYKPELIALLEKLITSRILALYRIFDFEKAKFVDFINSGNISDLFFNINTLSDYKKALYLWEETERKNSKNSSGGQNG